ncbi:MAG: PstS family phosphate ABC transporter substrate-binding protein [Bacteriovoracaceae bacterium]
MKKKIGILGILPILLSSFAIAQAAEVVKVDGSSTVFPITEAVAEEFQISNRGKMRATVGISGTGGGFKKFCRGETDVQNASRPILTKEMEACKKAGVKYYEFPIAFDALTVVVHPENDWVKTITVEELKKIWEPSAQGKITKWNQIRPEWPDADLNLYGAGPSSGTFDYFTEAIIHKAKASRGDYTASEDDNTLVLGVSADKYALGYLPYAYYEPNKKKLKALNIDGGPKAPKKGGVFPSAQTVQDGTYYPLSRPLFLYISANGYEKNVVKAFTNFYIENVPELAFQVKYVPLNEKDYSKILSNLKSGRTGTAFGGESDVGLKVEEILSREAKE